MSLTKADMTIAREYAGLCVDPGVGETIYARAAEEYQRTVRQIKDIVQADNLLADNPELAGLLQRRDPYLVPLNYIQLIVLRRYREAVAGEDQAGTERWLDPLLRSINALASGLRNTG